MEEAEYDDTVTLVAQDRKLRRYHLSLSQQTAPTPGQDEKVEGGAGGSV